MRPSARTEQQIWATSTGDERSIPNPQLKNPGAGTLERCHTIDTWQGPVGAPSRNKRVQVIWAQGTDLGAFNGCPRKPLGPWVFSIFHPNTLNRWSRGEGLGPCTDLSPVCSATHTRTSYCLPQKILYNTWQLTSVPEAEHIFHEPFGRSKHSWFLACTDSVCRTQTHNTTVSDDQQMPTAAPGALLDQT